MIAYACFEEKLGFVVAGLERHWGRGWVKQLVREFFVRDHTLSLSIGTDDNGPDLFALVSYRHGFFGPGTCVVEKDCELGSATNFGFVQVFETQERFLFSHLGMYLRKIEPARDF